MFTTFLIFGAKDAFTLNHGFPAITFVKTRQNCIKLYKIHTLRHENVSSKTKGHVSQGK